MPKVTLTDVTSGYSSATVINANNDRLETALDNTLSRDGSTPNAMGANIDLNSNRVINLGSPQGANDAARWVDVTAAVDVTGVVAPSQSGNSGRYLGTDGSVASWSNPNFYQDRTASEVSASVTPVNYTYPELHLYRYGTNTTPGTTDLATALQNAILVANAKGGGVVLLPEALIRISSGVSLYGDVVLKGQGQGATILGYYGSSTAVVSPTPSTRIYGCGIEALTLQDYGTGTLGVDWSSVSSSYMRDVEIYGFTTATRNHSPTSGYSVYNRFYNVTANQCTNGFVMSGTSSNAHVYDACRFNGATAVGTTGWLIADSNGNTVINCHTDVAGIHVSLTASAAGLTDGNVLWGNRIENVTTGYNVGTDARHTHVGANYYSAVTTPISDSGTDTIIYDAYYTTPGIKARFGGASAASGHISYIREVSGGSNLPFMRLVDENSGAGTPTTLQIESGRSAGHAVRVLNGVAGTESFGVLASGVIRTNQTTADTSTIPTTAVAKMPIYNQSGTLVGYIPIVADF